MPKENYIQQDLAIAHSVLQKLPGGKFGPLVMVEDMSGKQRKAVMLFFSDLAGNRKAYFCVDTGDYLGDALQ